MAEASEVTIRERFCEREKRILSPYAFLTENSRGRLRPSEFCPIRTEYQRDRDRIIHAKSFRRLMHKTQVFLFPIDEHYRTRMTHTLEVTQIARVIARALFLNEDLTEAVALGHDLGHTPFGHAGEVAMRKCFDPEFAHYKQSLRVVDKLENDGAGLNLTWEVRDGIVNHTGDSMASTLEGVIVKYADRIAYINHDIDDACRAGVLNLSDIPSEISSVLGNTHSERLNCMVSSVIEASTGCNEIKMTDSVAKATNQLRDFLFLNVYLNPAAKGEEAKAKDMLCYLFEYFVKSPEKMPEFYYRNCSEDGVDRCVCDYISGMTDRYAIDTFQKIFVPNVWRTPSEN